MEITLIQGLLLTLLGIITGIDAFMEGYFIFRPIVVSTVTGLILGDLTMGVIVGGLTELAYTGLTPVGGTQPPNPVIAGIMGPVLVHISGNIEPTAAVSLTLPFALVMQYITLFFYSSFSFFMPISEKAAEEGDIKKIHRVSLTALAIVGLSYAVVIFLSTYLAQAEMATLVNLMPEKLIHGFDVAGGILPAVGFALLMRVTLKFEYLPYLILGLLFATFIEMPNLLPIALLGLALAIISYFIDTAKGKVVEQGESDGI